MDSDILNFPNFKLIIYIKTFIPVVKNELIDLRATESADVETRV